MDDFISREALLKKLLMPEKGTMEFSADVLDAIMEAPAVDARPVRRGNWRWCGEDRRNDTYQCSECGRMNMDDSNYCPNCGAKMILEE